MTAEVDEHPLRMQEQSGRVFGDPPPRCSSPYAPAPGSPCPE